jgi:glycosyltransferase involved in cell wall biosynthesis
MTGIYQHTVFPSELTRMNRDSLPKVSVSVVITCYNYGQYVEKAIESVFLQTYEDFEIILVDDGSTDDSEQRIRPFLSDKRLTYIRQKNKGQANAKNTGIKHAKGEFIAFLDADDLWETTKLEKQLALFSNDKTGVVFSRARYIDKNGSPLDISLKGKYLQPRSGNVTNFLFFDNFIPFSSSIIRKQCLEVFKGFDESLEMGIDWDLWLKISTQYAFDFVDEPLLIYRVGHSGQMSKKAEKRQSCADRIMKQFIHQYPEIVSPSIIRRALAYTYCNRGGYFSHKDIAQANQYYVMALRQAPFEIRAYKGLMKNLLRYILPSYNS